MARNSKADLDAGDRTETEVLENTVERKTLPSPPARRFSLATVESGHMISLSTSAKPKAIKRPRPRGLLQIKRLYVCHPAPITGAFLSLLETDLLTTSQFKESL